MICCTSVSVSFRMTSADRRSGNFLVAPGGLGGGIDVGAVVVAVASLSEELDWFILGAAGWAVPV
eukprot:2656311-Pyramimonas_sp.AAC.1